MSLPAETPGDLVDPVSKQGAFTVNYNTSDMGLVDKVDPTGVKMILKPISTGSTGKDNPIGHRVVGADGTVKVQFRQMTLARQQALMPWSSGTPVQWMPPLNSDLYDYARSLILHPDDMGSDTTQDLVFDKAVCITPPVTMRDGGTPDTFEAEFQVYMDRAAFNTSFGTLNVAKIKGT